MSKVQHYGKVMQENFDEILFFSWLSGEILLETMFRKIPRIFMTPFVTALLSLPGGPLP